MPVTMPTVAAMLATTIDNHMKGKAFEQAIQEKPLLRILRRHQKTFGGGNDAITIPVKGVHSVTLQSYTGADTVDYDNPNNVVRARYDWKELHMGIGVFLTELKRAGIHVVDTTSGLQGNVSRSSDRDVYVLTDILDDKLADMTESWAENFNAMLWGDGTGNGGKDIMGIRGLLADDPTLAGTPGGIDQVANVWWRNRANLAVATNVADGGALLQTMHAEIRQLRRYGGRPRYALCGSNFIEAMEIELRANGLYSQTGFSDSQNIAVGSIRHNGVEFTYDPTLDDLTDTELGVGNLGINRCYLIDPNRLRLRPMEGEDMKRHSPARPEDQYVAYSAITYTGSMDMTQRNCHGVYQLA